MVTGQYPIYQSPPFFGSWENPIGAGKRSVTRKKQPLQFNSNFGLNFVTKPLCNFDLFDWVKKLKIKNFRDIFSRDALPKKI